MGFSLHFLLNTILFVVCFAMGVMFLALPIPKKKELLTYKVSLRVLASAYFVLAILSALVIVFNIADNSREHFTFTSISMSSFQALLFTGALITLFNPRFITIKRLILHITPFIVFVGCFLISVLLYGNPVIAHLNEIGVYIKNPSLWIRLIFYCFYIFQLIFYTWLYFRHEKKFRQRAMNYFSDEVWVKLRWVRIAFFAALAIGTLVMVTYFFPRKYDGFFTLLYAAFYLVFAFEYIKYNKIFKLLEPVVFAEKLESVEQTRKPRIRIEWVELSQQILNNNYYLESGINIEDIARRLRVGRTTLSNLINREEGVNFNTWINNLRIEKAKQLLIENPTESLSSISEKVGYSEQANFSRQFRKVTGFAPTLWRQRHTN